MSRAGAALVEQIAAPGFDGGGIVSIDDEPRKEFDAPSSHTASPVNLTASFVETIDAPSRLEGGLIEVTAGLVEIEAGLTKTIAAPALAPSRLGLLTFDPSSRR